jgi:CheY-like chemotaxis protein
VGTVTEIREYIAQKIRRNRAMTDKKILVIDDEQDVVTFYRTILEEKGHTVFAAGNAEEGLQSLMQNCPDLILLDLIMPEKTGIKFFSELKKDERFKDIPIVLITGIKDVKGGDHKRFFEGLRARVPAAYLEKPVDPATLEKTVNRVLGLGA